MKYVIKKIGKSILCFAFVFILMGCGDATNISNGTIINGPDEIVPAKAILVENLEDSGYTITEHTNVEGSDLIIDRVVAEKGRKYIDITYGLTAEDAEEIFNAYCEQYKKGYYILALNGNYVYCVSDKKTLSKAAFTSTANIGVQYINEYTLKCDIV